jgi:hypothetical protein
MFDPNDPWIVEATKKSGFDPERFHALGVVNFRWQSAERSLCHILTSLANLDTYTGWAIVHDMGDIYISNTIQELLNLAPTLSASSVEDMKYALKLYDVNRINRNQLTHFQTFAAGGTVELMRMKGPRFDLHNINASLGEIRRVADDILTLKTFLHRASAPIEWQLRKLRNPASDPGAQPPSPDRPALPKTLWQPRPQGRP